MRRYFKRIGATYRRARHVPARPRNPQREQRVRKAIEKARILAEEGVCDLFFGDESGFSLVPTLPYLWQKAGQQVELVAQSHFQRLNVIGFWKAPGLEEQEMRHFETRGRVNGKEFVRAVEEQLLPHLRRPAVLVLDNAAHHKSPLVKERIRAWRQSGLKIWFLPPYCPHLNTIEMVWKSIKHRWLHFDAYSNMNRLHYQLKHLLDLIGTQYRLSFA